MLLSRIIARFAAGSSCRLMSTSNVALLAEHLVPNNNQTAPAMINGVYLDASWHMPNSGRDARAEYQKCHLPGAYFFDIDEIKDSNNPLPHMLPTLSQFQTALQRWKIRPNQRIIIYDNADMMSSSRAWYTMAVFNVQNIYILNGGLPLWLTKGLPVDDTESVSEQHDVKPMPLCYRSELVRDLNSMKQNLKTGEAQVVDARPAARFSGQQQEPRPGLCSGHIPGSINVPWTSILSRACGFATFESKDVIYRRFRDAGVEVHGDRKIILSCGSGVTAAVLLVGLQICDVPLSRLSLYDGSWAEWGKPELGLPIERSYT